MVPLLERLDREGFTRRMGDKRLLAKQSMTAASGAPRLKDPKKRVEADRLFSAVSLHIGASVSRGMGDNSPAMVSSRGAGLLAATTTHCMAVPFRSQAYAIKGLLLDRACRCSDPIRLFCRTTGTAGRAK